MGHQNSAGLSGALRFLIVLPIISIILLSGTSALLEEDAPEFARTLNPLNTTAQISYLRSELAQAPDQTALKGLEAVAVSTIKRAPASAEAHSWAAKVSLRAGRKQDAQALFERALFLNPIDREANLARLDEASVRGDIAEILQRLDLIGRYWPEQFRAVAPRADLALATRQGAQALQDRLRSNPPWREPLIEHFMTTGTGHSFLEQLFVREAEQDKPLDPERLHELMARLLEDGAVEQAHRLFVRTLTEQGRQQRGPIHNARFEPGLGNSPFNWSELGCPASETILAGNSGGLTLRFLGTPARKCAIRQVLVLAPQTATWSVKLSADTLEAPAGLHWTLTCGNGRVLAKIDVPSGTYEPRELMRPVQIPERGCAAQVIELSTGEDTSSWRNRYSGTVRFHQLAISTR